MNRPLFDPRSFADIPLSFPFSVEPPRPERTVLAAIGKSAFFMTERFLQEHEDYRIAPLFIVAPEGSEHPKNDPLPPRAEIVYSTHPHLTERSFLAGHRLVSFIARHAASADTIVTLLSGGASALVEDAPDPGPVIAEHRRLLYSGLPIIEMNRRRSALSRIKAGKLTTTAPQAQWITFVMSDIPFPEGYRFVGSMPTFRPDEPRHRLIPVADGSSLHAFCAGRLKDISYRIVHEEQFLTGTVAEWRSLIVEAAKVLSRHEAAIFTGEPTLAVTVSDPGCGGRMAHLALLLAESLPEDITLHALSSDGMDGNSPYAGVIFTPDEHHRFDRTLIGDHLARFDAYSFFDRYGCAIRTGYTGVNLNDVVVVTRD